MATEELITTQKDTVHFYDCDYRKRIKLSSILRITGEIAGQDYINKGLDHKFLWENGWVFLLSRISFNIYQYPTEQQVIHTSTWECGKERAMFLRGYDIKDNNGKILIEGISGWVLVDPNTRQIKKPSAFPWPQRQYEEKCPNVQPLSRIICKSLDKSGERLVRNTDIDANGHMYNAIYADVVCDAISQQLYEKDVESFRINFSSEAKINNSIDLFVEENQIEEQGISKNSVIVSGKIQEKNCFDCQLKYKATKLF